MTGDPSLARDDVGVAGDPSLARDDVGVAGDPSLARDDVALRNTRQVVFKKNDIFPKLG